MITIDNIDLDSDRDRNVRLVYAIHKAAKKDMANSPMGEANVLNRAEMQRRYRQSYPDTSNGTPFDTAYRYIGINDKGKKGTPTRIKGADVYRIVRFLLVNLYAYGWDNVKQVLVEAGAPYDQLVELEKQVSSEDKVAKLANQKVGDLLADVDDPADHLRKMADEYDTLKGYLRQSNSNNALLMNENQEIRKHAKASQTLIERLLKKLATEKDESRRVELVDKIIEQNKKLSNLIQ